jgi:hypothetical protein
MVALLAALRSLKFDSGVSEQCVHLIEEEEGTVHILPHLDLH